MADTSVDMPYRGHDLGGGYHGGHDDYDQYGEDDDGYGAQGDEGQGHGHGHDDYDPASELKKHLNDIVDQYAQDHDDGGMFYQNTLNP
jgi:hypothetical protein